MELATAGDGDAFGCIYDRHHDRIRRHARAVAVTPADADDIVAIVFLEAWRRRDSIRFVEGSMLPWLLVTATNAGHNLSRSSRRYRALLNKLPPDETRHDTEAGDATAELRNLPLHDRQVLTLSVLYGLPEKEIALLLDIPPGTVKSRLVTAKRRLAARVNPQNDPARGVVRNEA